jgi:hypothetical protein
MPDGVGGGRRLVSGGGLMIIHSSINTGSTPEHRRGLRLAERGGLQGIEVYHSW